MKSIVLGRMVRRGVVGAVGQKWQAVEPRADGSTLVIQIMRRLHDAEVMVQPAVRPRGHDGLVPSRVASWHVVPLDGTKTGWVVREPHLRKNYRLLVDSEVSRERGTEAAD